MSLDSPTLSTTDRDWSITESIVARQQPAHALSPACPACGGPLMEIRHKLQCVQCHTICETCCEGGRG